jgi:hypothetical protein
MTGPVPEYEHKLLQALWFCRSKTMHCPQMTSRRPKKYSQAIMTLAWSENTFQHLSSSPILSSNDTLFSTSPRTVCASTYGCALFFFTQNPNRPRRCSNKEAVNWHVSARLHEFKFIKGICSFLWWALVLVTIFHIPKSLPATIMGACFRSWRYVKCSICVGMVSFLAESLITGSFQNRIIWIPWKLLSYTLQVKARNEDFGRGKCRKSKMIWCGAEV